jgi:UDP-N-acetylglucosamine acyltransferase
MIHPSAVIDPKAVLGSDVEVGPHCFIGPGVVLGDGCILHHNVTVTGNTACGKANQFFPGSVIGMPPQDIKYRGEPTRLEIGDDNAFREHVTVHPGTEVAGGKTLIGSHNRFLIGLHVGHDVIVGNDCIFSNYTQLAGHVHIEDKVTIGAMTGLHQFLTVGKLAYIGAMARVTTDVPPYMIAEGYPSTIRGFNEVGMKRWGLSPEKIRSVREAYMTLFSRRAERGNVPMLERLAALEARTDLNGEVRYLCACIRRTMCDGVYGRQLECQRRDSDADRKQFYGASGGDNI